MGTRRTPEQRLAELERKRAALTDRVRAAATREKIVVGAAVIAESRQSPEFAATLKAILEARVNRDSDKRSIANLLTEVPEPEAAVHASMAPQEIEIPPITPPDEIATTQTDPDPFADLDAARRRQNRQS